MCLTALEDPAVFSGKTARTGETVRNNGTNAFSCVLGNLSDNLPPPLLRLMTGSQDRTQEMKFIVTYSTQAQKVDDLLSVDRIEPHRVDDEHEPTHGNGMRPGTVGQQAKRLRVALGETSLVH